MQPFCHAGYMPEAGKPRSAARGRLLAAGGALAAGLVLGFATTAGAGDDVAAPSAQCQITDPRLPELSGLALVGDPGLAVNDGGGPPAGYLLAPAGPGVHAPTPAGGPPRPQDKAGAPPPPRPGAPPP